MDLAIFLNLSLELRFSMFMSRVSTSSIKSRAYLAQEKCLLLKWECQEAVFTEHLLDARYIPSDNITVFTTAALEIFVQVF